MRKTCLNMVHELAGRDERVVFIGSDLSPGLLADMKAEYPDRYYMEGITEANVVGMAAGMAMDGYMPYVNTIATFITRRCYEQVALDLCLHNLPVRLIGNGGGLVYAPLGPTHLAIEDLAIMRALPNMTVTAVSDADEMVRLMEASLDWPYPIYIRLGKGGDPVVSRGENGFQIGKGIRLKPAARERGYLLFISCGVMTGRCLKAAEILEREGVDCEVLHLHTLKPLDDALVRERVANAEAVVTVEEHVLNGGLGSAVVDTLIDSGINSGMVRLPRVKRLGIPDRFAVNYGVQDDLLDIYNLQPEGIIQASREILGERIDG